jgi:hypothetical protein
MSVKSMMPLNRNTESSKTFSDTTAATTGRVVSSSLHFSIPNSLFADQDRIADLGHIATTSSHRRC